MEIGPIWRAMMRNKTGAILIALQIAVTMAIMVNAISIMQERSRIMARPSGVDEHNIFSIASLGFAEDFNERVTVEEDLAALRRLPGVVDAASGEFLEFEERWTGAYIFENEWQSFRTRRDRDLELTTISHKYEKPGRYIIAVKVIDIFGNDTMTLVPVSVG